MGPFKIAAGPSGTHLTSFDYFMKRHKSVEFIFGGTDPPLQLCTLKSMNVNPPELFPNLSKDIKPVAIKSCRYSSSDAQFIKEEIKKLLRDGIIEESVSPWRS